MCEGRGLVPGQQNRAARMRSLGSHQCCSIYHTGCLQRKLPCLDVKHSALHTLDWPAGCPRHARVFSSCCAGSSPPGCARSPSFPLASPAPPLLSATLAPALLPILDRSRPQSELGKADWRAIDAVTLLNFCGNGVIKQSSLVGVCRYSSTLSSSIHVLPTSARHPGAAALPAVATPCPASRAR